jgi:hypothetical protein
MSNHASTSALHAARFVLALWNSHVDWECGRFDAVRALGTWDQAHRVAFLVWATQPWWPVGDLSPVTMSVDFTIPPA